MTFAIELHYFPVVLSLCMEAIIKSNFIQFCSITDSCLLLGFVWFWHLGLILPLGGPHSFLVLSRVPRQALQPAALVLEGPPPRSLRLLALLCSSGLSSALGRVLT